MKRRENKERGSMVKDREEDEDERRGSLAVAEVNGEKRGLLIQSCLRSVSSRSTFLFPLASSLLRVPRGRLTGKLCY